MTQAIDKGGRPARIQPFDMSGVERRSDGVLHYAGLHDSLLAMLRQTVDEVPDKEAVVEVGGPRYSYREVWDRSARVAGGLRARGIKRG
ncbi:MAG TPA: AMP-binding protein, partial [Acidimicrobiales bacterium]|nr:AMP-binding protein [Acidimicrobiales bacterium]